jgi:3-phenylpropionate/trans-cinnamate dioxygenase ferredoxin component
MEGAVWAVENLCPHALLPLSGGEIRGSAITCPRHGARFDLQTGQPLNALTRKALKVFSVRLEGEQVVLGLPHVEGSTMD